MTELGASLKEAFDVGRSFRLPPNRLTFGVAVAIRLFWIGLFVAVTVGLFG